ncbi:HAD-IIIC family phosphatase [Butyrivibrio sp. YAB3001]|uniref:HAD-IIIC family phosphatase n=1 Tax=Butyrivibrio sp. YAB3001 TaxID=1520812 RepID=UPI0008F62ECA|nr:HAD-IIIC family phosphatase [Butyrivibrio sp. YAB3001]SFC23098.1 HAD-superfamily phosphatase, subfamily IIIC/FkbH-like domain-containing protein [Butyrivibrio sp. YAB3001]
MQQIKLIIWDMDNTFWSGILAEGDIKLNDANVQLIKDLTDRGIVNSICSKNTFDDVKTKLTEAQIWDYFVFPVIDYEPKGFSVKNIIDNCQLRPENVLFIDDDERNLQEVAYHNKGINVSLPYIIEDLLKMPECEGEDKKHSRLDKYKILEKKNERKRVFNSNIEFLMDSNIEVAIKNDCMSELDRIHELIIRTNQLNYTKKRISKEALRNILNDSEYTNKYVHVKDKYGDYGIVGFCSVFHGELVHFLFSCRTIGMGIEQYVYSEMGFPKLVVKGEVVNNVNGEDKPSWINAGFNENGEKTTDTRTHGNFVIRGGCDLEQMLPYLNIDDKCITTEFNFRNFHRDHTFITCGCLRYSEEIKKQLLNDVGFLNEDCFDTSVFKHEKQIVILSLLMDYAQKVYHVKEHPEIKLAFGAFPEDLDYLSYGWREEQNDFYINHLVPEGRIKAEDLYNNLQFIRDNIDKDNLLILINGCEVPSVNPKEVGREMVHKEYNKIVDQFVNENSCNTKLLDMRTIVQSTNDLNDNIRHYKRHVYYKMAKELLLLIDDDEISVRTGVSRAVIDVKHMLAKKANSIKRELMKK